MQRTNKYGKLNETKNKTILKVRKVIPKNDRPKNGNMKTINLTVFFAPEKMQIKNKNKIKATDDLSIKPTGVYRNFTTSTNISHVKPLQG